MCISTASTCHGVSWCGFVNIAISTMVYIVFLIWRPPVVCYGKAAIVHVDFNLKRCCCKRIGLERSIDFLTPRVGSRGLRTCVTGQVSLVTVG